MVTASDVANKQNKIKKTEVWMKNVNYDVL